MQKAKLTTTSFRLSEEARRLLEKLSVRLAISQTAVLEVLIRDRARKEAVVTARMSDPQPAMVSESLLRSLADAEGGPAYIAFDDDYKNRVLRLQYVAIRPLRGEWVQVEWQSWDEEKPEVNLYPNLDEALAYIAANGWPTDAWVSFD